MLVELDKRGLEALIRGHTPSYEQMEHNPIKKCGNYIGGHADRWEWDYWALQKLSEQELLNIYEILKKKE